MRFISRDYDDDSGSRASRLASVVTVVVKEHDHREEKEGKSLVGSSGRSYRYSIPHYLRTAELRDAKVYTGKR
jgi:hypothetical protein